MNKKYIFIGGFIAIIGVIFFIIFISVLKNKETSRVRELQSKENLSLSEKRKKILAEISTIMILPEKEAPNVIFITDKTTNLKKYPLFAKAQKGDVIILYPNYHKMFILYSPEKKKILDINGVDSHPGSQTIFGTLEDKK